MTSTALTVRPVATSADRKAFVEFAWEVYKDDPAWIPPLKDEVHGLLNPKKNPWFEHAKAQLWLAERGDQVVDLGADPPDGLAAALGKPQLCLRMFEPGVLLRVEQAVNLVLQRRDPGRVVLVSLPREIDESLAVGTSRDWADGEDVGAHARWLARLWQNRQQRSLKRHYDATISCQLVLIGYAI